MHFKTPTASTTKEVFVTCRVQTLPMQDNVTLTCIPPNFSLHQSDTFHMVLPYY